MALFEIETQLHDFWLLAWSIKVTYNFLKCKHLNCFQDLILFSTELCAQVFDFEAVNLRLLCRSIKEIKSLSLLL